MYYLIAYDISLTKTRLLAVKLCKQAGLVRLQRSLFMGSSNKALVSTLEATLTPLLDTRTDSLCVTPLDRITYDRLRLLGPLTDKQAIAHEQHVVFL